MSVRRNRHDSRPSSRSAPRCFLGIQIVLTQQTWGRESGGPSHPTHHVFVSADSDLFAIGRCTNTNPCVTVRSQTPHTTQRDPSDRLFLRPSCHHPSRHHHPCCPTRHVRRQNRSSFNAALKTSVAKNLLSSMSDSESRSVTNDLKTTVLLRRTSTQISSRHTASQRDQRSRTNGPSIV